MNNTEQEKIHILSLYDITVSDKGGNSYEIIYKNDKVFYNKINFRNINTSDVVSCIVRVFNLKNDILLKEKFLIINKFTKFWVNSKFHIVKGKIKILYSYGLYKEQTYEEFVKSINDKYTEQLKKTPSGNYKEIDDVIITYQRNKNTTVEVDDLKTKKENIKRLLIEKKLILT